MADPKKTHDAGEMSPAELAQDTLNNIAANFADKNPEDIAGLSFDRNGSGMGRIDIRFKNEQKTRPLAAEKIFHVQQDLNDIEYRVMLADYQAKGELTDLLKAKALTRNFVGKLKENHETLGNLTIENISDIKYAPAENGMGMGQISFLFDGLEHDGQQIRKMSVPAKELFQESTNEATIRKGVRFAAAYVHMQQFEAKATAKMQAALGGPTSQTSPDDMIDLLDEHRQQTALGRDALLSIARQFPGKSALDIKSLEYIPFDDGAPYGPETPDTKKERISNAVNDAPNERILGTLKVEFFDDETKREIPANKPFFLHSQKDRIARLVKLADEVSKDPIQRQALLREERARAAAEPGGIITKEERSKTGKESTSEASSDRKTLKSRAGNFWSNMRNRFSNDNADNPKKREREATRNKDNRRKAVDQSRERRVNTSDFATANGKPPVNGSYNDIVFRGDKRFGGRKEFSRACLNTIAAHFGVKPDKIKAVRMSQRDGKNIEGELEIIGGGKKPINVRHFSSERFSPENVPILAALANNYAQGMYGKRIKGDNVIEGGDKPSAYEYESTKGSGNRGPLGGILGVLNSLLPWNWGWSEWWKRGHEHERAGRKAKTKASTGKSSHQGKPSGEDVIRKPKIDDGDGVKANAEKPRFDKAGNPDKPDAPDGNGLLNKAAGDAIVPEKNDAPSAAPPAAPTGPTAPAGMPAGANGYPTIYIGGDNNGHIVINSPYAQIGGAFETARRAGPKITHPARPTVAGTPSISPVAATPRPAANDARPTGRRHDDLRRHLMTQIEEATANDKKPTARSLHRGTMYSRDTKHPYAFDEFGSVFAKGHFAKYAANAERNGWKIDVQFENVKGVTASNGKELHIEMNDGSDAKIKFDPADSVFDSVEEFEIALNRAIEEERKKASNASMSYDA